jgi:hypothetical protein
MSINDATPSQWDRASASLDVPDDINQPAHYRAGEVEAIDYIAQQLGSGVKDYLLGNIHKYLHRHQFKGSALADLKKTEWYLRKLIIEHEQGG